MEDSHYCPFSVFSLIKDKGSFTIKNFIIYLVRISWKTVKELPIWLGTSSHFVGYLGEISMERYR